MAIRMAQYGTGHGHASGKARAMVANPDVDFVGVYEADASRRAGGWNSPSLTGVRWLASESDVLADPSIQLVAVEGRNDESLYIASRAIDAGKHLWLDKPAGEDWSAYASLVARAKDRELYVQMGYMFRYHQGFSQIGEWARSGVLGDVFAIRMHMSTSLDLAAREKIAVHQGGILYDLAGHMIDQIVWLLGRPDAVHGFARNDATPELPTFRDNTVAVLEFPKAQAIVDISAMECPRPARRYEVYGTNGTAIMEPMEPATNIQLSLREPRGGKQAGARSIPLVVQSRQDLYDEELKALVGVLRGERKPDRGSEHDLLVQETLLRATGRIGS